MKNRIGSGIVGQVFIMLLIILMGGLIFWEMTPYLAGVLGAVTIYVLFRKWMLILVRKGWNPNLAAILLMLISFIGILIPLTGILLMLGNRIGDTLKNSDNIFETLKVQISSWEERLGYSFTSEMDTSAISSWLAENLQNIAGGTFTMLIALAIMYFLLFYMFTDRNELRNSLFEYIPIKRENLKSIGDEIHSSVRSNAIGIPLVAIVQGIIALIGFYIFGVDKPIFWFVVVTVGSVIPFVGTFIGILPVFIIALAAGDDFQAWGVLIYGIVVVGSSDNLIRLFVLKKLDDVHPLITLIGVIIGVPLFGFIGLIFGPLLLSLFLLLIRIYKREYGKSLSAPPAPEKSLQNP